MQNTNHSVITLSVNRKRILRPAGSIEHNSYATRPLKAEDFSIRSPIFIQNLAFYFNRILTLTVEHRLVTEKRRQVFCHKISSIPEFDIKGNKEIKTYILSQQYYALIEYIEQEIQEKAQTSKKAEGYIQLFRCRALFNLGQFIGEINKFEMASL